ncbi:MAG: hypothetical protein EA378_08645 [Phycisphaerales bacterium]|nr:MAG: hypothetical protein EA378_08645 [Phycisphaerales bacterium]
MTGDQGQFLRREKPLPMHPRRVRQGVKLLKEPPTGPSAWAGERWRRLTDALVEHFDRSSDAPEALDYAKQGQTKRLTIEDGVVRATVQGRMTRPYQVTIEVRRFDQEQREGLIRAMADQAVFAAKLLAGEMPRDIDTLLDPLGTRLIPGDARELVGSCTCKDNRDWCKHLLCVMHLVADHLAQDPFVAFRLRGLEPDDLMERLRQSRAVAAAGGAATAVYAPVLAGGGDGTGVRSLEDLAGEFWSGGDPGVPLAIEAPSVSHPLLRRLGPSPFEGRRFPLVGLLATCYDVISRRAIEGPGEGDDEPGDGEAGGPREAVPAGANEILAGEGPSETTPPSPAPVSSVLQPKRIRGAKAKARPASPKPSEH